MIQKNSREIIDSIEKIENKIKNNSLNCISLKNLEDFYITTPTNEIYKNLEFIMRKIPKKHINFLELGSAINKNCIVATSIAEQNNKKLNYFGIEKYEELRQIGKEFLKQAKKQKIIKKINANIATGNYLHPLLNNYHIFKELGKYKRTNLLGTLNKWYF